MELLGAKKEKILSYDILLLPDDIESNKSKEDIYDTNDSIELYKLLKSKGINCANSYDLNFKVNLLDRRSIDIWLGAIWILNQLMVPTALSLMMDWFKLKKVKVSDIVHLDMKIKKGDFFTHLKYDGNSETLIQILNTLKDSDDTKD